VASGLSRQHAGTLRAQATGFVGRTADLARVGVLLEGARLVTLTGTGGVGKTRLAMRAAAEAAGRYPDGVRLVELSPLRDPGLLADTVASRLGLPGDERWATGYLLGLQCTAHLMLGEFGPSGVAGQLGLTMEYELGDIAGIAYLLGINAFLAAGQHRYQRAAWLFGASAPLWERAGRWYTGSPVLVALHQVAERLARSGLGEDGYWNAHAHGSATPLDRVIKLALANADKMPDAAVELKRIPPLEFN